MQNNYRFDLSDYLIHFFRDIDLEGANSVAMPEHMGWHSLYEGTEFPAIFMMRAALKNGRLWATWSYRNEVRTIYGPDPAVCFTDMPIAAFVEASQMRHARGEAMGEVALVFPKDAMRKAGALPVVYGLSQKPATWPSGDGGGPRIFPQHVLPEVEQFRHVSDVSSNGMRIDWTHEREWRWPFRGNAPQPQVEGSFGEWWEIPGLDFYKLGISGIGAIVKTREHANLVVSDMLALVDAGIAQEYTFKFVLVSDELSSIPSIRGRQELAAALGSATIDLDPYFVKDRALINQFSQQFAQEVSAIEQQAGSIEHGEHGGCWLWLHDGASPVVRALLHAGRVFVTNEGRYLANLSEYSPYRSLSQREKMTQELSQKMRAMFGIGCSRFSVLNSHDPNTVPFYTDLGDDSIPFFNNTWDY